MSEESGESFQVDLVPPEKYLHPEQRIDHERARTANVLALILVTGMVSSILVHLLVVLIKPDAAERFTAGYDKWLTIIGTLTGTAIGAYYGAQMEKAKERKRR